MRTVTVLDRVAGKGRQSLRKRLEAGYLAKTDESLRIAAEWFPLEEEARQESRPRSENAPGPSHPK
jgi:hypothetical protein